MNRGGGDVRAANADAALFSGQPPQDILADSDEENPTYADRFSTPSCPDVGIETNALSSDVVSNASNPVPPVTEEKNIRHGISGDYWVMSRDVAVGNGKDSCGRTQLNKTYNTGSVNEIALSIKNLYDYTQGPESSPDCLNRFQNIVIDGCDGGDPINNPRKYKFGSTLTKADGWEFKMSPLSKQLNEVNCDVSYKFFLDSFEVRG